VSSIDTSHLFPLRTRPDLNMCFIISQRKPILFLLFLHFISHRKRRWARSDGCLSAKKMVILCIGRRTCRDFDESPCFPKNFSVSSPLSSPLPSLARRENGNSTPGVFCCV
jgi:hypothetical protein